MTRSHWIPRWDPTDLRQESSRSNQPAHGRMGQKQTPMRAAGDVRIWPKADIGERDRPLLSENLTHLLSAEAAKQAVTPATSLRADPLVLWLDCWPMAAMVPSSVLQPPDPPDLIAGSGPRPPAGATLIPA